VFLAGFIEKISESIAEQLELEGLDTSHRRLGGGSSSSSATFCVGYHLAEHPAECQQYHEELRATTIFAVAVSTAILGCLFFVAGRMKWTRYASYVPICVMEAFMACVGYKVFKYALYFCNYEPEQFLPAAFVGVPLYFIKAYHIGNPAIVIPAFLIIPLAIFYIVVYGSGNDLDSAEEWMFPEMHNIAFYKIWTDSLGKIGKINLKAWSKTAADLAIMIIVCFLDCLLKMMGTEGKLPVKVPKNDEMILDGLGNIATTLCGSSVGYMQLKFNVINYGIVGSMDRRGGFIYAVLCGATFFSTIEHFNFLPRFFLGSLLFFAGSGFVAENLWGSRHFLSTIEWCQVLIILAVFILAGDLLYAVVVGGLLTCIDFIVTCASVPCVVAPRKVNKRIQAEISSVRRNIVSQSSLEHMFRSAVRVVKLKGQVFFASVQKVISELQDTIIHEESLPAYQRLQCLIFDCEMVDGIDASTGKLLRKLASDCEKHNIALVFTGPTRETRHRLMQQGLLVQGQVMYEQLDEALHFMEDRILATRAKQQELWLSLDHNLKLHRETHIKQYNLDPFREVFLEESSRRGCPWKYCSALRAVASKTILWKPGQTNVGLFLVHSGSIALFKHMPDIHGSTENWPAPAAIYRIGWFMNRKCLTHLPTTHYAVVIEDGDVLYWSQDQWQQLERDCPRMAGSISHHIMKQQALDIERADPGLQKLDKFMPEEVALRFRRIKAVQALEALGLYEQPAQGEPTILPKLPTTLMEDLAFVFQLFSKPCAPNVKKQGIEDPNGAMKGSDLDAALMCVGILAIEKVDPERTLDYQEFLTLAREAGQWRLSRKQQKLLEDLFDEYDTDKSAFIDLIELAGVLPKAFKYDMPREEVESLYDEWREKTHDGLNKETFVAFSARLLRLYHQDYLLYKGLSSLVGSDALGFANQTTKLTALDLAKRSNRTSKEAEPEHGLVTEFEHLLWSSDWRHQLGHSIEVRDIISSLLLPPLSSGSLLPAQVYMPLSSETSLALADPIGATYEKLPDVEVAVIKDSEADCHMLRYSSGLLQLRLQVNSWLEDPTSGGVAKIIWTIMTVLIISSVFVMILEPFVYEHEHESGWETLGDVLQVAEVFFTIVFTLDYLGRLLTASASGRMSTIEWMLRPWSLLDLAAILPMYVDLIFKDLDIGVATVMLRALRLVRLTRVARIAKMASTFPLFGPVAMITLVAWFIYLKHVM